MKQIYFALVSLVAAMMTLSACSTDDPFTSATENDDPRFLRPSSIETGQSTSESILRTEKFNMEVLVIPVDYTKVEWIDYDRVVAEGTTIDQQFPTGEHQIKILATTTTGKTTYRYVNLTVNPLDTDPILDNSKKARWFTLGTSKTISGERIEGITAAYIDGVQVTDFQNTGSELKFTIPEGITEGNRIIGVENEEGKFSCGFVNVTSEKWVEPGVEVIELWNETVPNIEWNAQDQISTKMQELIEAGKVKAGAKLTVNVMRTEDADYCSVVIINSSWQGIVTGEADPNRGDISINDAGVPTPVTIDLTDEMVQRIKDGGIFLTGHGYNLLSATVEVEAAGAEKVVWEGPSDKLAWTALEFKDDALANLGLKEGDIIVVYYDATEGATGAITTTWWNKINNGNQWETEDDDPVKTSLEAGKGKLEYTIKTMQFINEQGFAVVGDGFTVEKICVKH